MSLHPSGMFLAVAHITGFKVFSILVQKLFPMREIHLIFCTLVRYTKRGRYLLTNVKNQILVYETIDYKLIYCFQKHPCLVRQFIYIEETREVISSSDAHDLFLWRVIDSEVKDSSTYSNPLVYGHNSHEAYTDFDYCPKIDLFLGSTKTGTFVLYGDKCQVHLANFKASSFHFTVLKMDRESEILFMGTSEGTLVLVSLVHIFQVLRQRLHRVEGVTPTRLKVFEDICKGLGFYDEVLLDDGCSSKKTLDRMLTSPSPEVHERLSDVITDICVTIFSFRKPRKPPTYRFRPNPTTKKRLAFRKTRASSTK